jgi:hypothetical protein
MEPLIALMLALAAMLGLDLLAVSFGRDSRPMEPDDRAPRWL